MASDIISCLHLHSQLSRVVIVKEISGCDGSFILSCVLSNCIKNKSAVLFLSTHNSIQHYQNVGLRMNYNLQKYVNTGLINFYNIGDMMTNDILINKKHSLDEELENIKNQILLMRESYENVNVIFEGISHLFDLQYSLREVNKFCKSLINFVRDHNNSFILCHCNEASEDDVTHTLTNLLCHVAYTVLEVENLSSGWSTDVSGHLTVKYPAKKFEKDHLYTMEMKPQKYLFKLFDRGVKLMAPGTV